MRKEALIKTLLIISGIIVLVNLVFLDIKVFEQEEKESVEVFIPQPSNISSQAVLPSITQEASSQLPIVEKETSFCPASCLEKIEEATRSINLPTPKTVVQRIPETSVKEFYVPLGSGSSSATTWEEIKNAEAYFDPQSYGKIKSITFEALMRIPTANGRVYARLYNVDDKIGLTETEVWVEGSTGVRVESSSFSLPQGKKLYRVQLKSTMGYEAVLDLGRLKIVVE